jgi:hypothetical protein
MKAPNIHKTRNRPATGTIEKLQDFRDDVRPPFQRGLCDPEPDASDAAAKKLGRSDEDESVVVLSCCQAKKQKRMTEERNVSFVEARVLLSATRMKNQSKRRDEGNVSVIEERAMTAYKEYHERGTENSEWLHGDLTCGCVFPTGQMPVFLPTNDFMDRYEKGTEWYEHHFIIGHCQLLFHKYHRPDLVLVNIIFNNNEIEGAEICTVDEQVRTVYAIFHGGDHFVVMEMNLRNQAVYIVDGYGYALDRWAPCVKKVLIRIGKVSIGSERNFQRGSGSDRSMMTMTFENGDEWLLFGPVTFIKQGPYDCGPNAILKLMSVFGAIPPDTVVEMLKGSDVRRITMANYRSLLQQFEDSVKDGLSVRIPKTWKQG